MRELIGVLIQLLIGKFLLFKDESYVVWGFKNLCLKQLMNGFILRILLLCIVPFNKKFMFFL